jgi:hypothetical protein
VSLLPAPVIPSAASHFAYFLANGNLTRGGHANNARVHYKVHSETRNVKTTQPPVFVWLIPIPPQIPNSTRQMGSYQIDAFFLMSRNTTPIRTQTAVFFFFLDQP